MGKAVGTILKVGAVIAGAAAVVASGGTALGLIGAGGTLFGLGVSAATFSLVATGLTLGSSLLSPKPKAASASPATTDRLQASVNLRTPRTMVFGSTAMATDIRDQEWSGQQEYLHRFIVVASHKARAIREIWFDDKLAWSSAGGITSAYAGYLSVTPILEGSAANALNIGARMGASRRYTGCAYVYLRYKLTGNSKKTESPFAGGSIPSRMTIVGDGIAVPDPRASGFNAADQATWSTDANACRNPALAMLAYLLGWRINGKLAVGKGIPPARVDLASFATAANLCDEPVTRPNGTSEPRYRCDGIVSEGDETGLVLDNLKATMNAVLDDVDGKIRLSILYNDLATPIGELTTADVIGEYTWDQTPPLSDTFNIVRGGYTDPSTTSLYQLVDYPEVSIASADGIDRIETVNLPMVQSAGQAQRLAKLRLSRQQYGGTFNAVFQATAWKFQKGDAIRLTFYPLGWDRKLLRIADMTVQVDGTVPMMLREEHADIYAAYSDEAVPIVGTAPTTYDPSLWPVIQGIVDLQEDYDGLSDTVLRASSDEWLAKGEKPQAIIDHQALSDDWGSKRTLSGNYEADNPALGAARVAADDAIYAWDGYLQGLTPAWDDTGTDTPIVPVVYRNVWALAYRRVAELGTQLSLVLGPQIASVATRLARVASDGWLSTAEKPQVIIDKDALVADWTALREKAASGLEAANPAIGAARVAADQAVVALDDYLNSLTPAWNNVTADTPIDPAQYRSVWTLAYQRVSEFNAAITGQPGQDGGAVTVSKDTVTLLATSAGAVKPGQYPANVTLRYVRGTVDLTSGVSVTLTPSSSQIEASYASGTISITRGDSDGSVLVVVSYAGEEVGRKTIAVIRQRDAVAPDTSSTVGTQVSLTVSQASYGTHISDAVRIVPGASGQLALSAGLDMYAEGGDSTRRRIFNGGVKFLYRQTNTTTWYDASAETTAAAASGGQLAPGEPAEPTPAYISLTTTLSGLTLGTSYDIAIGARKVSGTAVAASIYGNLQAKVVS